MGGEGITLETESMSISDLVKVVVMGLEGSGWI